MSGTDTGAGPDIYSVQSLEASTVKHVSVLLLYIGCCIFDLLTTLILDEQKGGSTVHIFEYVNFCNLSGPDRSPMSFGG